MILLNLLDLATTLYITSHGGVELNPIMAYCIDIGIFPWVKFLVGTACCGWLEYHAKFHREARVGKWVVTAYLMVLCINNIFVRGVINQ
jgi:hypothetical protein